MKNYICINGNKTELTEEQLRQLGIESPKASQFERVKCGSEYYCIDAFGHVSKFTELNTPLDEKAFNIANYCTDKAIMQQRALHETLNRLLWRYSMEHDGDKIGWGANSALKFGIYYDAENKWWKACVSSYVCHMSVYFHTREIAENAIEEIVKPFLASHPDFKF